MARSIGGATKVTVGARRISVCTVIVSVMAGIFQAHHVPLIVEEAGFLLSLTGWSLVWGGFNWLMYMGLEPYVRRLWPRTLISWTRLVSGRARDPLVGRDVLIGVLAGISGTGLSIARWEAMQRPVPELLIGPALVSLRSAQQFLYVVAFHLIDSVQWAIGALFFLLVIRAVVRKTWLAALVLALLALPLMPGGPPQSAAELTCAAAIVLLGVTIVLRVGLLAFWTSFFVQRLFAVQPVTVDMSAWYFGTSLATLHCRGPGDVRLPGHGVIGPRPPHASSYVVFYS